MLKAIYTLTTVISKLLKAYPTGQVNHGNNSFLEAFKSAQEPTMTEPAGWFSTFS